MTNPSTFYTQQSPITNPGKYAYLFDGLPTNLSDLRRVVDGIYIHYQSEMMIQYPIPEPRLPEINLMYVEKMLERIAELDGSPLTEPRPREKRLVGCCRDAAVLFCAMARHMGIPARVRVGFANYFAAYEPDFAANHVIAEVWDASEGRWRLVDPDLNDRSIADNQVTFDPLDVPRDRFLAGGLAWQRFRAGQIDTARYGVSGFTDMVGPHFIRVYMIQDLAALNGMELLCWDCWGLIMKDMDDFTAEEWALLDQIAAITSGHEIDFDAIRHAYADYAGLRVPAAITRFDPLGPPQEVEIKTF